MKVHFALIFLVAALMASAESIKDVYADHFPVGMAVNAGKLASGDAYYREVVLKHFNAVTGENAFKWESLHPEEGRYDFREADRIADFAREHGLKLWGHALVWHHQRPDWIFEDNGKPATRELVLRRMRDHIQTVVGRYKDVIYGWDVVNEAIADEEGTYLRESEWYKSIGEDYIEIAFRYAREADPEVLLCYNDYSLASPDKRDKLERLLRGLLEKGTPIDIVGFQSHYSLYWPPVAEVGKSLAMVTGLGLRVAISEIDMSLYKVGDKSKKYEDGLPPEMEILQGLRYAELMNLYVEWSHAIERVTFWDIFDASNWRNYWPVEGRTDYAGLIDRDNRPKAAFQAVLDRKAYLGQYGDRQQLVAGDRPDIFFYLADDQNYWDYGFAGNETVMTPNADRLSAEGMLFSRAYTSMAICSPSRNSLYTGLYPLRNGCYMNHIPSRASVRSVAQHLKEQGYTVILAGKSHVNPSSVFDWSHHWPTEAGEGKGKGGLPLKKVRKYLEKDEGPACIFFASEFPHGPYPDMPALSDSDFQPKPYQANDLNTRKRAAGYYENIRLDDEQLGLVISMLEETGRWDDSLFLYAADHGIDGKYSTYDRGLRVPLILRWKDRAEAGRRSDALVHFVDVVPTLVEIAGGDAPPGLDGRSLMPLIDGGSEEIHEAVFGLQTCQNIQATQIFPGRAITTGRYKLAINFNAVEALKNNMGSNAVINEFLRIGAEMDHGRRFFELFDLSRDPFEQDNLAAKPEYREIVEDLTTRLLAWMGEQGDFIESGKPVPLLKPTLHPLDKTTRFKTVPDHLEGQLKASDYMPAHY
jgi:N-sulfoglucosamine sulfohydrolase